MHAISVVLRMALKTEMWAAFQHFNHSDIDHTFKRSPGICFRPLGDEEKPLPERPSRGRPQSAPPRSLEAPWLFHHKGAPCNESRRGPMLFCKSAADFSYDKVTASLACDLFKCTGYEGRPISKRCPGQFSPEIGATTTAPTKSSVVSDFHSRGVLDIDRNLQRGAGLARRALETTLENEQHFCEERQAELKISLTNLTETDVRPEIPEFIHDLGQLGIECRRLMAKSLGHSESRERLGQQDRELLGSSHTLSQKKLTPVLCRDSSARSRPRAAQKEAGTNWMAKLCDSNINSQRLAVAYAGSGTRHGKLPQHALTKSIKTLVAEFDRQHRATDSNSIDEELADEVSCRHGHIVKSNSSPYTAAHCATRAIGFAVDGQD